MSCVAFFFLIRCRPLPYVDNSGNWANPKSRVGVDSLFSDMLAWIMQFGKSLRDGSQGVNLRMGKG